MSNKVTDAGPASTWALLWHQRLGRAVVVVFVSLAAIYLLELGPAPLRAQLSVHLDRLLLPGMIALLVARTWNADGIEERRYWRLIAAGLCVWFVGSVLAYLSAVTNMPRWVDLAVDVFYILLYLSLFLASDQQPHLADGWSKRDVLYRFSSIGASLFIALMFGYFVVVPWAIQPSENAQYFASFNLYVTLDTLLAVKFTLLFAAARSPRWRRGFALIAGVAAVMAIGDLIEGLGYAGIVRAVVGGRIDVVWLVPHFLLATMILTCTGRTLTDTERDDERAPQIQSLLPFYAFALPLVHLGLYLFGYLDPEARAPREAIVLSGLVLFALLSLAQQVSLERAVASLRSDLMLRALDDKLRQSQRLESIGRLAGGIAHDFNNLLMVIKSYAELATAGLGPAERGARDKLVEIDRAADRATDLVSQLLAFGRRQVLRPEVVRINDLIQGLEGMLSRIIGDDVELRVRLDPAAGSTRADPAHLEQVVVNLVVNARDAMPRGGVLSISTSSVAGRPDRGDPRNADHRSVEIVVSDTGDGIDPAIRDRIFEPYFTTKEMEKGTGLGLATVYGIVEQSGGTIEVESEAGGGSSFRVRLLQVRDHPPEPDAPTVHPAREVVGRTVLLTEDEKDIREALAEYLENLGLRVLRAADGVEALDAAASFRGTIDLLVTDLVMPRMSGPALAARLVTERPGIRVIYVSGYTPEAMRDYGVVGDDAVFLQKPFQLGDLAATIRELLDG